MDRLSRRILNLQSELDEKLKRTGISLDAVKFQTADAVQDRRAETPAEKVATTSVVRFDEPQDTDRQITPTRNDKMTDDRGFFFNAESGALADLGKSLDPVTLAVLGILITLATTTVQLVKGN